MRADEAGGGKEERNGEKEEKKELARAHTDVRQPLPDGVASVKKTAAHRVKEEAHLSPLLSEMLSFF